MNYSIFELESIDRKKWIEYVSKHEKGTFFHTPYYLDAIGNQPGYTAIALFVLNKSGEIEAFLTGYQQVVRKGLLSGISKRIVVPQLPLYNSENPLRVLLTVFKTKIGKHVVYSEFRAQNADQIFRKVSQAVGLRYVPHFNIVNKCTDLSQSKGSISSSKRRQINKSTKSGVRIEENPNLAQVQAFYDILRDLYVNKVKKPLMDRSYFEFLFSNVNENGFHTKFLLVIYKEKVIGGIVAPISKDRTIHEHYIAGLDYEYKDQYPSVMATWAAIDYASRNGIAIFDFMGAGKPDEDYGVRDFKLKFGGELIEAGRYEYIPNRLKYMAAIKGFEVYQKVFRRSVI